MTGKCSHSHESYMLRDLSPKLGNERDKRFKGMLLNQRLWICQECEHASGRGMRTSDHCRSCVLCRLRVRVHSAKPRQCSLGFFRNSAQVCPVSQPQFPTKSIQTNDPPCYLSSRCLACSSPLNAHRRGRRRSPRMGFKT